MIKPTMQKVDWYAYAQRYDMLLAYNPFYQELHNEVLRRLKGWKIREGGIIADIGAGTGNYSVAVAQLFPQARILHIDNSKGMNAVALEKSAGLHNFCLLNQSIEEVTLMPDSLNGLICINAIYTFPNPARMLQKMYEWLAPGARAILVDPGRPVPLLSLKMKIAKHLLLKYGLGQTLKLLREGQAISQQNAYIRKMQKNGIYWTHSHEDFCKAVRQAGFRIESSEICFDKNCDMVAIRKP